MYNQPPGQPRYVASCGFDFGAPPEMGEPWFDERSGEQRRGAYWKLNLRPDLRAFAGLGIKSVRFALLFNGLMYGVNEDIPKSPPASAPAWDFRPVPLTEQFLRDFRELVATFGDFCDGDGLPKLTLMPVIFGFEFVQDPYVIVPSRNPNPDDPRHNNYADFYSPARPNPRAIRYSAGRRGMALSRDQTTRLSTSRRWSRMLSPAKFAGEEDISYGELFLFEVLERLLQEFEPDGRLFNYRNVIHSWDLCGEPENFTIPRSGRRNDPSLTVPSWDMHEYFRQGIDLVRAYNFRSTIGYRLLSTKADWGWSDLSETLGQFHTYDGEQLPRVRPGMPALVGEAATTEFSPFDSRIAIGHPALQRPTLLDRLQWFEALDYQEVFLWSGGRGPPDERHSWGSYEQRQIREFNNPNGRRSQRFVPPSE